MMEANGWIDVNERLPEAKPATAFSRRVLVWIPAWENVPGYFTAACYNHRRGSWWGISYPHPTHWQEGPAGPKEPNQ